MLVSVEYTILDYFASKQASKQASTKFTTRKMFTKDNKPLLGAALHSAHPIIKSKAKSQFSDSHCQLISCFFGTFSTLLNDFRSFLVIFFLISTKKLKAFNKKCLTSFQVHSAPESWSKYTTGGIHGHSCTALCWNRWHR